MVVLVGGCGVYSVTYCSMYVYVCVVLVCGCGVCRVTWCLVCVYVCICGVWLWCM